MSVTRKDVEHIAELARLKFKDKELENFTVQLNEILEYMEQLNELDTENIDSLLHPVEDSNIFRDDAMKPSIGREEALKNAPQRDEEFFKVPRVIGGE